jgi:hypothetical protein
MRIIDTQASMGTHTKTLKDLIATHRAAYERFADTCDELDRAQTKYERKIAEDNGLLVPLAVTPAGDCWGGWAKFRGTIDARPADLDRYSAAVGEQINDMHQRLRRDHGTQFAEAMVPEYAAAVERAIAASEQRALGAIPKARAHFEQLQRKAGIAALSSRYDAECEAEFDARLELVVWQPSNETEVRERAAYVASSAPFQDAWCEQSEFTKALMVHLRLMPPDEPSAVAA